MEREASEGTLRRAVALACVSAALLLLEVSATRLLSFVSWHHFAFMVVSVAMLGLGAASVFISLSTKLRSWPLGPLCAVSCMVLAVTVVGAYVTIVETRVYLGTAQEETFWLHARLAATYTALLLPLLAGGVAMAATLTRLARRAALVYGLDLLGGAAGCLLGVVLAGPLSLEQSFIASAVAAAAAAMLYAWPSRALVVASGATLLLMVGLTFSVDDLWPARAAEGKFLHHLLEDLRPPGKLLATHNTPLGRVDLVDAEGAMLWSRNKHVKAEIPHQLRLVIDGDAGTPVALPGSMTPAEMEYLDYLPSSIAFAQRPRKRVLIIGSGGGQDVLAALRHDVGHVDAVEVNPAIVQLLKGRLLQETGRLFERPDVSLIRAEGRSFVRASSAQYDVVQLGLVDTWAASGSGGLSLTENFLYTREAYEDYLRALRPGGVVSVTRWLRTPPREVLRLAIIAAAALRERGVEQPTQHMAVVGLRRQGTLLVGRDPLSQADCDRIETLTRERHLDLHYIPCKAWPPGNVFQLLAHADEVETLVAAYPYDVSPVLDDRPFFFDYGNPGDRDVAALFSVSRAAGSGSSTVAAVLIQAAILSLLLLVAPVALRRTRVGRGGLGLLGYFALTGTGFMFLEVPMLQRLALLLGHPTLAVALTLGVLLGSSGLAALLSERLTGTNARKLRLVLLALAVVAAVEALFGPELSRLSLAAPEWSRPVLAGLRVALLGLFMGLATPHGLRVASQRQPELTPLLWATTSFASVLGSILAVGLALHLGFGTAIGAGALCYLGAAAVASRSLSFRSGKN